MDDKTTGRAAALLALVMAAPCAVPTARAGYKDVQLDGRTVRLQVAGEGSPTVVFDSGLGDGLASWRDVFPQVSAFTRAVAWDRPGYGGSAPSPEPRTFTRVATELRGALRAAGLPPPYVLVGHSLGGAHVRAFASLFPMEVAGLVLVDPISEDGFARLSQAELQAEIRRQDEAIRTEPAGAQGEWAHAREETAHGFSELRSFRPATVPSALLIARRNRPPRWAQTLLEQFGPWIAGAAEARLEIEADAGHYIQRDDPRAVVDSIRRVVFPSMLLAIERAADQGGAPAAIAAYRAMKARYPREYLDERALNSAGYRRLGVHRVDEAIELFRLNAEEFPASANVHDSLGEAYAAAGKRQEAIDSYRRSLALDPANTGAARAIERLEQPPPP